MKTYSLFMKGCCMIAALLMVTPILGRTSSENLVFKARQQTNITRSLSRSQLTSSDTISLQGEGSIYALSIDAVIQQPREASFARIVLEDTEGQDYLVAESDRFRNDTTTVQLSEYCEETAQLSGITPLRLKCYLAGDAALSISNLHISTEPPTRGDAFNEQTRAAMREAQVQDIVERINEYNRQHGKLWRAGVNSRALMEYGTQDDYGETDAYIANFKYYTEGIYEMGERIPQRSNNNSPYVPSFDWRSRHGKCWITPIRDQFQSGCCTAFAAVAATEAATQLFYNRIFEDSIINLSEYAVAHYSHVNYYSGLPMSNIHYPINYIKEHGAIDEATLPFPLAPIPNMPDTCPEGNENFRISDYFSVASSVQNVDSLKKFLIHNGPAFSGMKNRNHNHTMALIGYDTICADTLYRYIYKWDVDTIYSSPSHMIGKTYWIFKNSYGHNDSFGHNGYAYLIFYDYQYMHNAFFISYPILSRNNYSINIEDNDGDGYFNWGIGERPDSLLPVWAELEEDGDDSNRLKGPMDEYGYLQELSYPPVSTIAINHNMTDSDLVDSLGCSRFLRCSIRIKKGVTFTIHGDLAFYSGPYNKIYMTENSILKIDGGTLVDPTLYKSGTGSKVIIMNGGKIAYHKKDQFILPYGISMEMDEGNIFY